MKKLLLLLYLLSMSSLFTQVVTAQSGTIMPLLAETQIVDVAYIDNEFIIIGHYGLLLSSSDGLDWQHHAIPDFNTHLYSILEHNGQILIFGEGGLLLRRDLASTDTQWEVVSETTMVSTADVASEPLQRLTAICKQNEVLFGLTDDKILRSESGLNWRTVMTNEELFIAPHRGAGARASFEKLACDDATLIALSNHIILTSEAGWDWQVASRRDINAHGWSSTRLDDNGPFVYANGVFMRNINAWSDEFATIWRSTNGIDWEKQLQIDRQSIKAMNYLNGRFMALTADSLFTSTDNGETWIESSSHTINPQKIAYGNNTYVSIGEMLHTSVSTFMIAQADSLDTGLEWQTYVERLEDGSYYLSPTTWVQVLLQVPGLETPLVAHWRAGGQDTIDVPDAFLDVKRPGSWVTWGYFYADPSDIEWGDRNNPEVFVKIWYDYAQQRLDLNFVHVSVPDIEINTRSSLLQWVNRDDDILPVLEQPLSPGRVTLAQRYSRHSYASDDTIVDTPEAALPDVITPEQLPLGGLEIENRIIASALINTEEAGRITAIGNLGGFAATARGDEVAWGYFYADPNQVNWGNPQNPELFVKIWFDVNGRIDANYVHVSVPDIMPSTTFQEGGITQNSWVNLQQRYSRHSF